LTRRALWETTTSVASVYLFTWNLGKKAAGEAHALTLEHLALWGTRHPFIACLQELPGQSSIAQARRRADPGLAGRSIAVVEVPRLAARLALVHHSNLTVVDVHADEDDEFVAAVFRLPSSNKQIRVVGLHAQSKADMQKAEDQGGSRALLRQAINAILQRGPTCDHTVILGDFNSPIASQEMQSWNCFYVLSENRPRRGPSYAHRRGLRHAPLYAVSPQNRLTGTYSLDDSAGTANPTIDFIAVDEGTLHGASSRILTEVATKTVWDFDEERPSLSDHLPVEGFVDI
jgi:endonuclease/exonuclease/phosphatase family metal-dependent hydrolase